MAIHIFDGPEQVAQAAAELFVQRATERNESGELFNIALSGGSTPNRLFATLAGDPYRDRIDWKSVHFFWGDERTVPPDHADSNYGAANEALLPKVDVPARRFGLEVRSPILDRRVLELVAPWPPLASRSVQPSASST